MPAAAELTLTVEVGADTSTLPRVLTVLRQRGCVITRVDYAASDRHRPGYLHLGMSAPARQADRVPEWVGRLVDVTAVHRGAR